jgi:hypothetical protein
LRDIVFLKDKSGAYILDRPYVSLSFTSLNGNTLDRSPRPHHRRLVKNEIVFALGVALLELSYGRPLSELATSFDLNEDGKVDAMTEYSIPIRLAKEIHLRELPNYAKATSRCVDCNFDTSCYDLAEKEFRERFYEGVVVLLREDWEYANK